IVGELSALEKALSKGDFSAQRGSLDALLQTLRPMHLKSLEGLEPNARGRLITSLLRVSRQPRPAAAPPADVPASDDAAAGADAAASEPAATEATDATVTEVPGGDAPADEASAA